MSGTEILKGRPTWAEVTSQGAAFVINAFNLWTPAPITDAVALTMSAASGAFTGLEVANLTTPEKDKKIAALLEGIGVMVANRGAAMTAVGIVTGNPVMWMQGFNMFLLGGVSIALGYVTERKANAPS